MKTVSDDSMKRDLAGSRHICASAAVQREDSGIGLCPAALGSQFVDTLVSADVAHSYAHVLKLLPLSAGLAAALALGRYSVAGAGVLQVLPTWECRFIALSRDNTASFPRARHQTGIGLSYASR